MRLLVLKLIEFYWHLYPETNRRQCIFKETCSKHVYRRLKEKGLVAGFLALINRVKKCRNGHSLYLGDNGFEMKLVDGTTIYQDAISPNLLEGITSLIDDHASKTN